MTEAPGEPLAGKTILIVDDNPVNLGVVVEHLEHRGFEVAVALGGEEALDRARFLRPDIILLNVMMPGINGFETCRRLKAMPETAAIPVIFMTALGDVGDKTEGFAAGGVDYVSKPFQVGDLLARVTAHIALGASQAQLRREVEAMRGEVAKVGDNRSPGARYRRLFETAADGILLVDCAGGKIVDVNPAAAAMLDRPAAELIGRPLAELPGFGASAAAAFHDVALAGQVKLGDWRVDRPGFALAFELFATYRRDADGDLVELCLRAVEDRAA